VANAADGNRAEAWRGLREDLGRSALGVLLAAALATALVVAGNRLPPTQHPLTAGLVLGGWLVAFYAVVGFAPLAVACLLLRAVGRGRAARAAVSAAAAAFLAVALFSNWAAVTAGLPVGPLRFRWGLPAALVLSSLGLLLVAAQPVLGLRWRRATLPVALAGLAATLAMVAPGPLPPPPLVAAASSRGPARPDQRFLLVALDGADWRYIDPLIARGELPHLAALRGRGAFGPLKTFEPTLSPVIWTTIATGVGPRVHGVRGFFAERLAGISGTAPEIRSPSRLGFRRMKALLRARRLWGESPVGTDVRRVPAYWNIASARGAAAIVVNWWVTWPAERVLGEVVSDRLYPDRLVHKSGSSPGGRLTYPDELFDAVRGLVVQPADLPLEVARRYVDVGPEDYERMRRRDSSLPPLLRELPYFVASFETHRAIARELLRRDRSAADALVLFRIVDKMCHGALAYSELVTDHLGHSPADLARFGSAVSEAYREADRALGELVASFGEGNVVVVSDHGFELEHHGRPLYEHGDAPSGIFIAAGPAFRPGPVEGLDVFDVLPTLLYLKGLPTALDQRGQVPRQAFAPEFLATHPERHVASYGSLVSGRLANEEMAVDMEVLERLRALGYIRY